MKSVKVGQLVKEVLDKDNAFRGKVYPIVAPVDVQSPYVTYIRTGTDISSDKDGYDVEEVCRVEISVHADSYYKSVELIELVEYLFDNHTFRFYDREVEVHVTNAFESFENDCFVQSKVFTFNFD